jgi:hypothetical protein
VILPTPCNEGSAAALFGADRVDLLVLLRHLKRVAPTEALHPFKTDWSVVLAYGSVNTVYNSCLPLRQAGHHLTAIIAAQEAQAR